MKTVNVVAALITHDNSIFATQRGYGDCGRTISSGGGAALVGCLRGACEECETPGGNRLPRSCCLIR